VSSRSIRCLGGPGILWAFLPRNQGAVIEQFESPSFWFFAQPTKGSAPHLETLGQRSRLLDSGQHDDRRKIAREQKVFVLSEEHEVVLNKALGNARIDRPARAYDVAADGRRFFLIESRPQALAPITEMHVVQSWFEELKRLVPTR
jgi:hypothetical protein